MNDGPVSAIYGETANMDGTVVRLESRDRRLYVVTYREFARLPVKAEHAFERHGVWFGQVAKSEIPSAATLTRLGQAGEEAGR